MEDARIVAPRKTSSQKGAQHGHQELRFAREVIETVALTLLIFFAVHFSIQPFSVDGPSMQPGLHTGELVMTNLLTYDFTAPQRGDVIVFHPPSNPSENYVKRVIGVPGDTIQITPTSVYVDNVKLDEPYIYPLPAGATENISPVQLTLKKDEYWVMGDNRTNSSDSRAFGPIVRQSIIGKAEVVAFPLNTFHWLPNYATVFAHVHQ